MPRTFAKLVELYDQGLIDPLIFREPLPLAEAASALTMLGARQTWARSSSTRRAECDDCFHRRQSSDSGEDATSLR